MPTWLEQRGKKKKALAEASARSCIVEEGERDLRFPPILAYRILEHAKPVTYFKPKVEMRHSEDFHGFVK